MSTADKFTNMPREGDELVGGLTDSLLNGVGRGCGKGRPARRVSGRHVWIDVLDAKTRLPLGIAEGVRTSSKPSSNRVWV